MRKLFLFFVVLVFSFPAQAQDEKIDPDRPGESVSPGIVSPRSIQFEAGFLREMEKQDMLKHLVYEHPELVARIGLIKTLELRALVTLATETDIIAKHSVSASGFNNIQLGAKYQLTQGKKLLPDIALVIEYDLNKWRSLDRDTINGFHSRLAFENTITKKLSIGYNAGIGWETFKATPEYIYTISPKYDLSEKLSGFLEFYGILKPGEAPEEVADASLAWFISKDLMLDATAGFGINDRSPRNYFSVGGSFRFKNAHH